MLEDIEEGELDYGDEDEGELNDDDDLPDLPEYDPIAKDNVKDEEGEEGEILSDNEVSACALIKNFDLQHLGWNQFQLLSSWLIKGQKGTFLQVLQMPFGKEKGMFFSKEVNIQVLYF